MTITRLHLNIFLPALLLIGTIGCDDENPKLESENPDGAALNSWFDASTEKEIQHFTLDAHMGGDITGEQGTILKFSGDAFVRLNDEAITGTVDIELIEVYDRASMLLTKRPTNGKNSDGKISTLVSGGEFYVNAIKGGEQLKLKSGFTIVAPTENTGEIDQDMKKFDGKIACEGNDCDLLWEEDGDRGIEIGEFQATGGFKTAYFVFQSKFGWTNIDRWYNDTRPKTTIFVDVPEGFNNTNCAVYIAYDGEPAALGSFDKYDEDTNLFTEHYGLIPVGLDVHFILVSIVEGEIHYAIQAATITENHVEHIDDVDSITEAELVELIHALP
jgi:hypothetical protein